MTEQKKKIIIIISSIFILCLMILGGLFLYYKIIDKKESQNNKEKISEKEQESSHVISGSESNIPAVTNINMTNLYKQTSPQKLLVIIFNYTNGYYENNEKAEKEWSEYIFGTGNYSDGTSSINDYFKEISNGKFYFEPILLGDNKTGVYSVNLDKEYTDRQNVKGENGNPSYNGFEADYDAMKALNTLIEKGLDISKFKAEGIDYNNYNNVLVDFYDSTQEERNPQWYNTYKILYIYPPYNTAKVDLGVLTYDINNFGLHAHLNSDSDFGTIAHELLHTLGTVDVYNYGSYCSDIMSDCYPMYRDSVELNAMHINPYYKILFGWSESTILNESKTIDLYPQSSSKYNPYIITTKDPNQYYVLEYRKAEGFDSFIENSGFIGVNIWRIDQLGLNAIYEDRKGISLEKVLVQENDYVDLTYYKNKKDVKDTTLTYSNINIKLNKVNEDESISVEVTYK